MSFQEFRSQLRRPSRIKMDRSVAATVGLLGGVAISAVLLTLAGGGLFSLTVPGLTLYASLLPLSVIVALKYLDEDSPSLPVLAALRYMAIFVVAFFAMELVLGGPRLVTFSEGGLLASVFGSSLWLHKLVGFRLIATAALAGVAFTAVSDTESKPSSPSATSASARQQHAGYAVAMEAALAERRRESLRAMEEFDRRLGTEVVRDETTFGSPDIEEECEVAETVLELVAA